jgi:hypothetical protein
LVEVIDIRERTPAREQRGWRGAAQGGADAGEGAARRGGGAQEGRGCRVRARDDG